MQAPLPGMNECPRGGRHHGPERSRPAKCATVLNKSGSAPKLILLPGHSVDGIAFVAAEAAWRATANQISSQGKWEQ
jgi:hypothetical protein